jgi:LysM repeat protein
MAPLTVGLLGAFLLLAFALAPAHAQRPTPVISTPTPQPTATPTPNNLRERLLLTPEALRQGQILHLPLIMRESSFAMDAPPDSFPYVVQPGDTLWSLAIEFSRTWIPCPAPPHRRVRRS